MLPNLLLRVQFHAVIAAKAARVDGSGLSNRKGHASTLLSMVSSEPEICQPRRRCGHATRSTSKLIFQDIASNTT